MRRGACNQPTCTEYRYASSYAVSPFGSTKIQRNIIVPKRADPIVHLRAPMNIYIAWLHSLLANCILMLTDSRNESRHAGKFDLCFTLFLQQRINKAPILKHRLVGGTI
mmetsp:Transcript_30981/g.65565  ORF Transcript_30981/g.65565 Transcript_30981/m.65565 type:complete len:109 (+) Transcript_30981:123-449(+)